MLETTIWTNYPTVLLIGSVLDLVVERWQPADDELRARVRALLPS
jgi:hypothetical protein